MERNTLTKTLFDSRYVSTTAEEGSDSVRSVTVQSTHEGIDKSSDEPLVQRLGDAFEQTVDRYPDRTAVFDVDEDVRYTYAEWNRLVDRLAAGLKSSGVSSGDRIGVLLHPRLQAGTLYWAAQKLGAVFVPYDVHSTAAEFTRFVSSVKPTVVAYSSPMKDVIDETQSTVGSVSEFVYVDADTPSFAISLDEMASESPLDWAPVEQEVDAPSHLLYSGHLADGPTTISRSHEEMFTEAIAQAVQSQWEENETILSTTPIYRSMGLRMLVTPTLLGGKWVAQRSLFARNVGETT